VGGDSLFSSTEPDDIQAAQKRRFDRIRFDNTIRFLTALPSFIVCLFLWMSDIIPSMPALIGIFIAYGVLQTTFTILFKKANLPRVEDAILCLTDIIGISLAILLTGGIISPLYFLYFVPFLIKVFHRDWDMTVLIGFSGVVLYAGVVLYSFKTPWNAGHLFELGGRTFFMAVPAVLSALIVNLFRKKEEIEKRRLYQMNKLTSISQRLNSIAELSEVPKAVEFITAQLNASLGKELKSWSRIFIRSDSGKILKAIQDPSNPRFDLKQELSAQSCPAYHTNTSFYLKDSATETGCPTEKFSYRSHLCTPISGAGGETLGVIFSGRSAPHAFGKEETQFLTFIARALGLTLQRLLKFDEMKKLVAMDSCVTATFVASGRSLEHTLNSILDGISTLLPCKQTGLMLWSKEDGLLKTLHVKGPHGEFEKNLSFQTKEGVPGRVFESEKYLWTSDLEKEFGEKMHKLPFGSLLCLPLTTIKGEPLGVINVWLENREAAPPSAEIDVASTFITRAASAMEIVFNRRKLENGKDNYLEKNKAA